MFSTRRHGNVKKPRLKRKQRRTRRNQRKRKGGTLDRCIRKCTDQCYDEWVRKGLPTKNDPTKHGWYIIHDEDTISGITYVYNYLRNTLGPTKSVDVDVPIHTRDGTTMNLLDAFKKPDFDLPLLGHISSGGYELSIDRNKLVWKRGSTIIPYVYDEEPTE